MNLSDLSVFQNIVIQCHDNPDPDAIASGFALFRYFSDDSKRTVRLVYAGKYRVQKANILMMLERLNIPLEYITELDEPADLLITVDGQFGQGNMAPLSAKRVAVIDHHPSSGGNFDFSIIKSAYGSCASVVYGLLREVGVDPNNDPDVATALYYGLYTDTNSLSEIVHPADKDLRDDIVFNGTLLLALRNTNLSKAEIAIAGAALKSAYIDEDNACALAEAASCDPNILGFISDMLLQVNVIESCVVFCRLPFGIKYSARSCTREIHAGEMAGFLAEGVGSGGGHAEKAGGFLREDAMMKHFPDLSDIQFFIARMLDYYQSYDVIYAQDFVADIDNMSLYKKQKLTLGFVRTTDVLEAGTRAMVRTLEADLNIYASKDIYIMIGIVGEVYPINKDTFEKRYIASKTPFPMSFDYDPIIRSATTQEVVRLSDHARCCTPSEESFVYARPLERTVKVFTSWDPDHYMLGKPGDYLAAHKMNTKDVYVIARDIFHKSYAPVQASI